MSSYSIANPFLPQKCSLQNVTCGAFLLGLNTQILTEALLLTEAREGCHSRSCSPPLSLLWHMVDFCTGFCCPVGKVYRSLTLLKFSLATSSHDVGFKNFSLACAPRNAFHSSRALCELTLQRPERCRGTGFRLCKCLRKGSRFHLLTMRSKLVSPKPLRAEAATAYLRHLGLSWVGGRTVV